MPKIRFDQYLSLFLLVLLFLFQQSFNLSASNQVEAEIKPLILADPAPLPILINQGADELLARSLSADAVVVIDVESASLLFQRNSELSLAPASTTKLMTALVAIEEYDLDTVLEVKEEAFALGNTMDLESGERITVRNLLYGLLISSGNDAAFVLANNYSGGYEGFIDKMNGKAQDLNLNKTHFTNPSGLDDQGHMSTARDLAVISREVVKNEFFRNVVQTKNLVVSDVEGIISHRLSNTNELLGFYPDVVGIKTGTTELAGEVLITLVDRNGRQVLVLLMNSKDRYGETTRILDWTFANYEWRELEDIGYDDAEAETEAEPRGI